MTPEAQRIAIAKACPEMFVIPAPNIIGETIIYHGDAKRGFRLCDPLSDLNIMNEVEKVLTGEKDDEFGQLAEYYGALVLVCGLQTDPPDCYEIDLIRATAAQRAESFLKAIGKWTES